LPNDVAAFTPTAAQLARLSARLPELDVVHAPDERAFRRELPTAEAVVVWSFETSDYAEAPRLEHVFTPSAGRERIALDPARRVQAHFGTFHGAIMAETLLAMMLFLNRRLDAAVTAQREHRWERDVYATTRRLAGQTALIVGYGAIGRRCAALLRAVGMTVVGVRRRVGSPAERGAAERVVGVADLPGALAAADHVACILPGDTGTDRLLGHDAFEHVKPGAFVYNLGRGNAIELEALAAALASGRVAGAYLDVFPEEPLPADSPLWSTPNLHVLPHASAIGSEYLDLYFDEVAAWFEARRQPVASG